jgi:hypothetical protein
VEDRLNILLRRTSTSLKGENLLDVAAVCADMVVYALHQHFKDDPEKACAELEGLLEAMRSAMRGSLEPKP